jgi:UDP-N-acetylglucosamine 2-epimerase
MRSGSLVQGFSGLDYISVTGNKIKDTLTSAGLPKKGTRIHVVGNPAYDGFINFSSKFTNDKKIAYKKHLNLSENKDLYALFLSPSSYSEEQIKEVMLVVETVLIYDRDASILVKFHPKTEVKYIDIFRNLISCATSNYSILTGYTGDYTNLNIILSSKCILQKQSTVGYISMLVSKPIISYNFMDTGYSDDMYKVMKSSLHCESTDDMLKFLSKLNSEDEMQKLQKLQEIACANFCKRTNSAASNIVDIIDDHFSNQH